MTILFALLALVPSLLTPVVCQATNATSGVALSDATKQYIQALAAKWTMPGVMVAVVAPGRDEVLTFGVRDVAGNNVTNETYWAIASNSKLCTSVGINLLIEDGVKLQNGQNLSLSSLMKDVIPGLEFKLPEYTNNVTLRDCMTHRSGIPQHILAIRSTDTPSVHTARTKLFTINNAIGPDAPFQYSNHNYELMARIPEVLANTTLDNLLQTRVWGPLGMQVTTDHEYAQSDAEGRFMSQGFLRSAINGTECQQLVASGGELSDVRCVGKNEGFEAWKGRGKRWGAYGGAQMLMRGVDIIKWTKELNSPKVIPSGALQRIQTALPRNNTDAPSNASAVIEQVDYQLGTISQWYRGTKVYTHDGALPGSNSMFTWSPEKQIGVFVIANDDAYSIPFNNIVTNTVMDDLLGGNKTDWEPAIIQSMILPSLRPAPTPAIGRPNITFTPAPTGYANFTYSDPAYGNITVTRLNASSPSELLAAGLPTDLIITASAVGFNLTGPAYAAVSNSSSATNYLFTHVTGPHFNYTAIYTRDSLAANGSVTGRVGKLYSAGPAVFAEDGIAVFGNIMLQSKNLPLPAVVTENLREKAPVFFARVGPAGSTGAVVTSPNGAGKIAVPMGALLALAGLTMALSV